MTTEEKLQHFYDVSVGEAIEESNKLIENHQKELEKQFDLHRQEKQKEAEILLKAESDRISREINKSLSASQLEIKRSWTKTQNNLKDKLFAEVRELLESFTTTPQYVDYLLRKINEVKEFAGDDEVSVYLTPSDQDKLEDLSRRSNMALQISDQDFWGGVKAMIPQKNILIDNSFQSAFQAERQNFTFDGGLTYE